MYRRKPSFDRYQLDDRVVEALKALKFRRPTEVQHKVIPLILQKRNLLVEAPTGSGKTAAYGLPLITRCNTMKKHTEVLILVPSRELALQVEAALKSFTTNEKVKIGAIYGGMSLEDSEAILKSEPHIIVAVPGRLKDLLRTGKHDVFWRNIKFLVLDEADKLLEPGFRKMTDQLVSNVRNNVQVALFSATISKDMEEMFLERFYPVQVIRLSPKEVLKSIHFRFVNVSGGQVDRYLAGVLKDFNVAQALIFHNKREAVYSTANFLRGMGFKTEAYHGLLDQVEREAIMSRFRDKHVEFLVATDLAARGIDVVDLPCVINASFPDDVEVYLHRCGRTGRAGNKGYVFNLITSKKEEILVKAFHGQIGIKVDEAEVNLPAKEDLKADAAEKLIKLHLNRGKKDKIRPGDVVGFLVNELGADADDIGTIANYDTYVLVDVPETTAIALDHLERKLKIKGKSVKVSRYSLEDQKKKAEAVRKRQFGARDKKSGN